MNQNADPMRPRGSRADAITESGWFLIKSVSRLRLTGQIRLLSIGAAASGAPLVVLVPPSCQISQDLKVYVADHPHVRLDPTLGR